jgi:UDP-2,3-diacylglucosamine pyrophosphatase LpxH
MGNKHYRTLVLSDIHLGTKGSKTKQVVHFLKHHSCEKLILNGDIIDGWQLKKSGSWKKHHTKFFKRIFKMIEDNKTEVIYLRGNHDDFLDSIIPIQFGNLSVQRDYMLESGDKRFYVIHGDIFDSITTNLKWIAKLGDIGYTFLLWLNTRYNNYRTKRGLPYYSLSQAIKSKVKSAVSYIGNYEQQLVALAKIKKCDGIICGHIHQPALKVIDDILYMNSGDWVESLSALAEDFQGNWSVVYFPVKDWKEVEENLDEDIADEPEFKDIDISQLKNYIKINNSLSK